MIYNRIERILMIENDSLSGSMLLLKLECKKLCREIKREVKKNPKVYKISLVIYIVIVFYVLIDEIWKLF
jgi:hypothetical protein